MCRRCAGMTQRNSAAGTTLAAVSCPSACTAVGACGRPPVGLAYVATTAP